MKISSDLLAYFKCYMLKMRRLKIAQLEKARFIKMNELKLTRVIFIFSLYASYC